ncbi:TOTE conflict system archaeo-eukaryotic primase domain-containing protein [Catenulispora pinisilvae]|uniref:TOTE conflict system archaeo-eukaryotic primase domain-containing protein n=1 Tax=Catenulispora pinisilvae TaxID=2705253 RepID=UPI003F695E70
MRVPSPAQADPYNKNLTDAQRTFFPLTDQVLFKHLSRQAGEPDREDLHAGLYPMLADDRCQLLVADFDGKDGSDWRDDAVAFHAACRAHAVPAHVEISRSGAGAHVWIFFEGPVDAATARAMGLGLVRQAIGARPGMSLNSYDRLFPAQDFLPVNAKGGFRFGNLIALPLHGRSRAAGTCVFVDPGTWAVHGDQFAYLAAAERLSPLRAAELAEHLGQIDAGPAPADSPMPARPRRSQLGKAPAVVHARSGAMLTIATVGMAPQLLAAIKHASSFFNPEFFRKQAQRFSTWNEPRLIRRFNDTDPDYIVVPRGLRDEAAKLIAAAGGELAVTDELPCQTEIDPRFTGTLTEPQQRAVKAMSAHDAGVLQAPTGFGKTVVACALIEHYRQRTAIVVNRAELVAQWTERLRQFLDLPGTAVGTLGAGKDRRGFAVDVVMLQSLARRDAAEHLLDDYGLVIVDECHCVAAPAAEAVLQAAKVGRWIGLSATPYRADSMDPLITMLLGPIRHEADDTNPLAKHLIVHPTAFRTAETGTDGAAIQAVYSELAADPDRNALIAAHLADAHVRGRRVLALANRVEHLAAVADALSMHGVAAMQLHGGLPPAERTRVRSAMSAAHLGPLVVLAIDKIAGEGLDADLDALFLMNPVSFKGRVIQQVGRIMRTGPGKTNIEVHDYLDAAVPRLERNHHKRRRLLEKRGFTVTSAPRSTAATRRPAVPVTAAPHPGRPGPAEHTEPTASEVRAWAHAANIPVSLRGRISADLRQAYRDAHRVEDQCPPTGYRSGPGSGLR